MGMAHETQTVYGDDLGQAVHASHLAWQFEARSTREISGKVASRTIGPVRVSWINLALGKSGWRGKRTAVDVRAAPEPYLIFVMPLSNSIRLSSNNGQFDINEHACAIWDSTQLLEFELAPGSYEQISVLVPQRLLRVSKGGCISLHCSAVQTENPLSELAIQHMETLSKFLDTELRPYELALSNVTVSVFDSLIASLQGAPRAPDRLIAEIKDYIECYITDEALSPKTIAAAFDISPRYLHKLFENEKSTVNQWIIARRLTRSTGDLLDENISVTETAFKWGFNSVGHYSRVFKSQYGVNPSSYRKIKQDDS